jgi:hypothetical protein
MSTLLEQASLVLIPSGYKEDIVYSQIPTNGNGDLSFTRASNGTRVNSAGLVEVCPWNLALQSNNFASGWSLVQSSKSTGFTDPVGNSNAIKLNYTTVSSAHYINQSISLTGSNAHSVYAKAGELQFLQIASAQSTDEYANFNLSTGVIGTYGSRASNVQIENVGNGWYRCSVVLRNGSNGIFCAIVQSASSDWFGISAYSGANNTDGLYLYGGQVNTGTLKPYFPTTDRLNVPRLTYQNGGGGCPSLLLEPQRTNLALYSEQFDNAVWVLDGDGVGQSVTPNYSTSPDGTNNADRLQLNKTGGTFSRIKQSFIGIGVYSWSVYMKSNTASNQNVGLRLDGTGINCLVTPNWQRFSVSTILTTQTAQILLFDSITGNDETADISIWGAQIEAGAYPTTYIPTTTASATRVADACFKTGISSLIGQSEGFIAGEVEGLTNSYGAQSTIMSVSDGTTQNRVMFSFNATTGYVTPRIFKAGSTIFVNDYPITLTQKIKFAIGWGGGRAVCYVNGTQALETTGLTFFSSGTLTRFGADDGTGSNIGIGKVSEYILGTTNLTNAQLQSLTI